MVGEITCIYTFSPAGLPVICRDILIISVSILCNWG